MIREKLEFNTRISDYGFYGMLHISFLLSRLDYTTNKMNLYTFVLTTIPLIYFTIRLYNDDKVKVQLMEFVEDSRRIISVIVVAALISFVLESFHMKSIKDIFAFLQLVYIIFSLIYIYLLVQLLDKSNELNHFLRKLLVLSALSFSIFSILVNILPNNVYSLGAKYYVQTEYILGISLRQEFMGIAPYFRYSSVFSNPNQFGFYMYFALCFLYYNSAIQENNEKLKFNIFLFIILFLGLMRSGSRASILSFLVFVLIIGLMSGKRNFKKITKRKLILPLSLLGFIIGAFIIYIIFRRGFDFNSGRLILIKKSLPILSSNIFFGIGTYQFREFARSLGVPHIHNSYIQLIGSGGLYYLFQYLIVLGIIFRYLGKSYAKSEFIYQFYLSLMISFFVYQFFESTVLIVHPILIVYCSLVSKILLDTSKRKKLS